MACIAGFGWYMSSSGDVRTEAAMSTEAGSGQGNSISDSSSVGVEMVAGAEASWEVNGGADRGKSGTASATLVTAAGDPALES